MPYKSIIAKRVYQREYMRRRRSNIKVETKAGNGINVRPKVRPSVRPKAKANTLRDDLRVDLPGGEAVWGYDETGGARLDDDLRTDLPGGEAIWGFDETKKG